MPKVTAKISTSVGVDGSITVKTRTETDVETSDSVSTPPIAAEKPHRVVFGAVPGETRAPDGRIPMKTPRYRDDPWFWLRDDTRKDEEVLAHLRRENEYGARTTRALDPLRAELYVEHKSHLKETDEQPPYPHGEFYYYTRTEEGKSYTIYCRKAGKKDAETGTLLQDLDSAEEVTLDVNVLGDGKAHCDIRGVKPSPDHTLLAYSSDFTGNETYSISVKNIATGELIEDNAVNGVHGSVTWGADQSHYFYTKEDGAKRPYQVYRHKLGSPQTDDVLLYTEPDELFWVGIGRSKSNRFLMVCSESTETSEWHTIDLNAGAEAPLTVFQPRTFGLRYYPDNHGENFLVLTNKDKSTEMKLMHCPVGNTASDQWVELLAHSEDRQLCDVELFKNHAVIEGRENGLTQVWVMAIQDGLPAVDSMRRIGFKDDLFEVSLGVNKLWDSSSVRLTYSSLASPVTWYTLDMVTALSNDKDQEALTIIKRKEVLNFDGDLYRTKQLFATAADGVQVPISMVMRKDLFDGDVPPAPVPVMLYGYGSYGISIDPGFDARILPYLDRGMVYCIAHIRGGGEMGRHWYEKQGKYLMKRNTFTDFIACAEHLIDVGIATSDRLAIEGRSAGGLLMGAVLNMRPDLFKVAVAGVPFVDVMNTMSDPSIPLTCGEWEEWGNPNEHKYFDCMLSYSPYDNVREQPYPNILITAGLHDPRVAYWEPAKWASKLRSLKTDNNEIIVKMDLDSGHFSASDRYKYLREKAWEQAYVLDKLGLRDTPKRKSTLNA